MADEQINIDIRATDDASAAIDDVADKVDKLEDATPEVKVTADTAAAEADLRSVVDAAELVAKADARIVVEAKIDEAKGNIRELKRELDSLSGAGDGGVSPARRLETDLDGVAAGSDRAKGALSGFAGNAIGELPGIGQAMGPAVEGLGQLVEGALAGEIAIGGLVAAGGILAGVAVAFKIVTDGMASVEASKAFRRDRVDDWSKALRDAGDEIQALRDKLAETEKVEFRLGDSTRDAVDSIAVLIRNGELSGGIEAFNGLVRSGVDGIGAFQTALLERQPEIKKAYDDLGDSFTNDTQKLIVMAQSTVPEVRAFAEVIIAAQQASVDLDAALVSTTDQQLVFGDSAKVAAAKAEDLNVDLKESASELRNVRDRADDAAGGITGVKDSFADLRGELSDRSQYLQLLDALDTLKEKATIAYTAGATGAGDAEAAQRDYEQAVIDTKQKVIDYTDEVAKVPKEVTTAIAVAVGNSGADLEGLLTLLDQVERTRTSTINVKVNTPANFNGSLYAV